MSTPNSVSRAFKGIWIPKEIWLNPNLSIQAKALWAEIGSLYCEKKEGCFASNEYLCAFLGCKLRQLQNVLAELKEKGLLKYGPFDGRQRILIALMPQSDCMADMQHNAGGAINCMSDVQKIAPLSYIENKEEIKDKTPPNPRGGKPATAGRVCESFGSHVKLSKEEHSKLIEAHSKPVIDALIDEMNDYCAAKGTSYKDYAAALRSWLKRRKANPIKPTSSRKVLGGKEVTEYDNLF